MLDKIPFVPADPSNYDERTPVDMIVIHSTAGSTTDLDRIVRWFQTPGIRVSAHYLIGKDGRTVGMVRPWQRAWHAGNRDANTRSIGIELCNRNTGIDPYPPAQVSAAVELCAALVQEYSIPIDRIVGHKDIPGAGKSDPVGLDLDWFREQVRRRLAQPPARPPAPGAAPYPFGIHDLEGAHIVRDKPGWVVASERIGCDPQQRGGGNYRDLADRGLGVIVRLNNGYAPDGTIPTTEFYEAFARRCRNFVEESEGCHRWVIGNEPNLAIERPSEQIVTPEQYAACFNLCQAAINSLPGHELDEVIPAPVGPWNTESGSWRVWQREMLDRCTAPGGIAVHAYTHGDNPEFVSSEAKMRDEPYTDCYWHLRTYINSLEDVPLRFRDLPAYLTEADMNQRWPNENRGWVKALYREIRAWNEDPTHQRIWCAVLYRWDHDDYRIKNCPLVIQDLEEAMAEW